MLVPLVVHTGISFFATFITGKILCEASILQLLYGLFVVCTNVRMYARSQRILSLCAWVLLEEVFVESFHSSVEDHGLFF
jgi:hypothetical protein